MPIPDYEQVKVPALEFLADGRPRRLREIYDEVGEIFGLTNAWTATTSSPSDLVK